jgi:hypothetical protein
MKRGKHEQGSSFHSFLSTFDSIVPLTCQFPLQTESKFNSSLMEKEICVKMKKYVEIRDIRS